MKRFLVIAVSYVIIGIGAYYILSGSSTFYGGIIFAVGICGVIFDIFQSFKRRRYNK
nr:hypothetical protein [Lysinibacillus timonensis]